MKIVYGVLRTSESEETIASLPQESVIEVRVDGNYAKARNELIDEARKVSADYLFMLTDNVIVKDMSIFVKYIDAMEKSLSGLILHGYSNTTNRIKITDTPNPILRLRVSDEETVIFNQIPCEDVIGIKLSQNDIKFDENLSILDFQAYIRDCVNASIIPFNTFFYDVEKSWEAIVKNDVQPRVYNRDALEEERKQVPVVVPNADINAVIEYTKERHLTKQWRMM